jgi:nitrogen fixation protein FixH
LTVAVAPPPSALIGVQTPRIAPPQPAKSKLDEFRKAATDAGIKLLPWQETAGEYLTATGPDGWMFREVAIVAARQNGKTELLVSRILMDLRAGKRVLHMAQIRTLPREVFMRVAWQLHDAELIPNGIRFANGQEKMQMRNGGSYRIVAAQRGARGLTADTLIFDELREFEDYDAIGAATPTLTASPDPQTIYLSNAGSDASVVLNDLKRRSEDSEQNTLAYLEWSADLARSIDDREGWAEANPALGHFMRLQTLEEAFTSKPPAVFETEHLCRWVASMQPRLVSDAAWMACQTTITEAPNRPSVAFNMDPSGRRASAVMSWQMTDGRIALVELREAEGDPIDVPTLGADLKALVNQHGAKQVAYASWSDKALAGYVPRAEALDGKEYANASENFARLILSGRLAWDGAAHVSNDLTWTARKPHDSGAWQAVPATHERSVTAVLAAVRATWLASRPRTVPRIG